MADLTDRADEFPADYQRRMILAYPVIAGLTEDEAWNSPEDVWTEAFRRILAARNLRRTHELYLAGRPVTGQDVRPCTCFPYVEQHGEPGLEPNPDCPVHFPPTRCCTCRDIEDDANPECVLHGDPAVNGTADYARPGDLPCAGCPSRVRRYAGAWWHVGPFPQNDDHTPRPAVDPIAELPYETTLDERERHNR